MNKNLSIILLSIVSVGISYILLDFIMQLDPQIFEKFFGLDKIFGFVQKQVSSNIFFFYSVFILIPVTLIFESIIPADTSQKLWNFDVTQDFIWLFITKLFHGTLFVWYGIVLAALYEEHFSSLTIESLNEMPVLARFIMGMLLADFAVWVHHFIRHKVPFFWYFHAIHHSQKRLNMFSDFRVHLLDYVIARTLVFIPLFILSFDAPEVITFLILRMFYTRFYHGNVRTNMGPLKYILVTPQSHRIHHSLLAEHQDKNFGLIFCIWDRIFGTHVSDDEIYPATGIHDETFPHPKDGSIKEISTTMVGQFIYPFRKIYESVFRG